MNAQVLVLDVASMPVAKISWRKVVVWILEKVVEIVDVYPDKYIRSPSWTVQMPSIVRFVRSYPHRQVVKFSRHSVFMRDHCKCQYCGRRSPMGELQLEHVIPRAQGGKTSWENVVAACVDCNQLKANRTPEQAGMKLLSRPVKPKKPVAPPRLVQYRRGDPAAWQDYLRNAVYWNGSLDES